VTASLAARLDLPRLDVRCRESLGSSPGADRCQLMMGHDGRHAVMYSRRNSRVVRTWPGHESELAVDSEAGFERLPWMLGFPVPGWVESV
jgi:hypothetical protein